MPEPAITGIAVDLNANTLHVQLDADRKHHSGAVTHRRLGTIDIGAGGKLLGIEVGERYVAVMEPEAGTESLIRSAEVELELLTSRERDAIVEIVIPRRGADYEISWPSGNQ